MTSKAASNILPALMKKLVVRKVTPNFREAVELVSVPLPIPGKGQVLIKNRFLGINASDINYTAARYFPGVKPPFDCGFEGRLHVFQTIEFSVLFSSFTYVLIITLFW